MAIKGATTGTTGSIGFRNVNPGINSSIPPLSQVTISDFSIVNETVEFDNAPITIMSPISIKGVLILTAGGAITQNNSALITATGGSFTVLGNFNILLNNGGVQHRRQQHLGAGQLLRSERRQHPRNHI